MKKYIITLTALALLLNTALAQVYTAAAKLDTNRILMGEQADLQLKVFMPAELLKEPDKFIQWPALTDSISKEIEIVEASAIDTSFSTDKKTAFLTQNLTLTSFDTGFFVIPPFRFLKGGDSSRFFETQAMLLEVQSVKVDTTQAIKDIKPPIEAPYTLREALPYIIAVVALVAIIYLLFLYFKKKRKKPEIILENIPEILPHVLALNELEKLKQQKLWQGGQTKLYHTLLTEIVRIYIENRFSIKALEQTSDEIILSFRSLPVNNESKSMLEQILVMADLVKFAKSVPLPAENDLSYTHAIEFVRSTAQDEVKTEIEVTGENEASGNV